MVCNVGKSGSSHWVMNECSKSFFEPVFIAAGNNICAEDLGLHRVLGMTAISKACPK
ncbi:MAG: hypothetical protein H8D82_00240 [Euryarchaeota archaeon]|nr:hypothetical protein [Euryarchaeota archaeon]